MNRGHMGALLRIGVGITGVLVFGLAVARQDVSRQPNSPPASVVAYAGEASVLLADGRRLVVGGGASAPSSAAYLVDRDGMTTALGGMRFARAWHTATMLSTGQVLIVGGIGPDDAIVQASELFDPATQSFTIVDGPLARAFHTATLVLDGTVVLAGGVGDANDPLATIERWDPRTGFSDEIALPGAIVGQAATLLPDGEVLLWGGVDGEGRERETGELYDPASGQVFLATEPPESILLGATRLEATLPTDGASGVGIDGPLGLRFSTPIAWPQDGDFTLVTHGRVTPLDFVPAENGMEVFLAPAAPLRSNTTYTLTGRGITDSSGQRLDPFTVRFATVGTEKRTQTSTAERPTDDREQVEPDEVWAPNSANGWRTAAGDSDWQRLPPLQAATGVTALAGQVLRLNGRPLTGVSLQIDDQRTRTDSTGRFLLQRLHAGHAKLVIDGGKTHGRYEAGVEIAPGVTTVLPYTIWLTTIDWAHGVDIPSPTTDEVVVTTPTIPGLELRIPAGTVIYDDAGKPVTRVSITPVPVNRPPFPLPNLPVPLYFTVQPGGAYIKQDWGGVARLIYPNRWHDVNGTRYDFWNYDADARGWYVYGQGAVVPPGNQIMPDPSVGIYEFTGAMVIGPGQAAHDGPPPGSCGERSRAGDPVDLATGLLVMNSVDLSLPDVIPITFTRTYRQGDSQVRPFGLSTTHNYEMFLVGDGPFVGAPSSLYRYLELILPDGGRIRYDRICPNPGVQGQYANCCYLADGTHPYTTNCTNDPGFGTWEHTSTPTRFYGSRVTFNGVTWNVTLRDGTTYMFPEAATPAVPFNQARGALVGIRDRFGNIVNLTRDTSDSWYRLKRITSPNGRWIDLAYTDGNPTVITQATDSAGRAVHYYYDGSSRLDHVSDVDQGITRYTYSGTTERLSTISDARREYDCANGGMCPPNPTLTVAYNDPADVGWNASKGVGTVKQETLADGTSQFNFSYNMVKHCSASTTMSCTQDADCASPSCPTCRPAERCVAISTATTVTDPNGHQRQDTFNDPGYCKDRTTAFGDPLLARTLTRVRQPGSNFITSLTEPLPPTSSGCWDRRTQYDYFGSGPLTGDLQRVTRTSGPCSDTMHSNTLSQLTYDYEPLFHQLRSITDLLGHGTTITYPSTDPLGRPTGMLDATHRPFAISVDSHGRLASLSDPDTNTVTFGYDGGDLISVTDPLFHTTKRWFDAAGRVIRVTDAEGRTSQYDYFNHGWLKRVTDGLTPPGTIDFLYDPNGNVTTRTDNRHSPAAVTTYGYNRLNLLTSRLDPLAPRAETFAYQYRNLIQHVDRRSNQTDWCYDSRDRLRCAGFGRIGNVTNTCNASQPECTVASNYDAMGGIITYGYDDPADRLKSATDSLVGSGTAGTITLGYDDLDEVATELTPLTLVAYTYDLGQRRTTSYFYGAPFVTRYCYDDADRLEQLITGSNCTTSPGTTLVNITHDSVGRRQDVTLPNGAKQTYGYDAASRVSSIQYFKPDGSGMGGLTYAYDAAGNRLTVGGLSAGPVFGLPNGLPAAFTASYDSADRIMSYVYDPNGNLTSDGPNSYTWNKRDQLVLISGANSAAFAYDAFGRRRQKQIGSTTTNFAYDGLNVAYELSSSNAVVGTLLTGLGLDETFQRTDSTGAWAFHTDALGSTIDLLRADAGGGTTQVSYSYEPYGRTTASAANGNAFQFTGREKDEGTGLYYERARYYVPLSGRFASEDPLRVVGGPNHYSYVWNNPANYTDRVGLGPLGAGIGGWIGTAIGYVGGGSFGAAGGTVVLPGFGTLGGAAEGAAAGGVAVGVFGAAVGSTIEDRCTGDATGPPLPPDPCEQQYANDVSVCQAIRRRRGPQAAQRCYSSAAERYSACLAGRPLPPLDTWNN